MPFPSDTRPGQEGGGGPRKVATAIDVAGGASAELVLYNESYALVAESANPLRALLAPGRYQVQARIGSESRVTSITVPHEHEHAHYVVDAPSWHPNADVAGGPSEAALDASRRFVGHLRGDECGVAVVIYRARDNTDMNRAFADFCEAHSMSCAGGPDLLATAELWHDEATGVTVFFAKVDSHVWLAEHQPHSTRRMTVPVFRGCLTQVLLAVGRPGSAGTVRAISLADASIGVLASGDIDAGDGRRQDTAVHALRHGRYVTGWVKAQPGTVEDAAQRQPLLALFELSAFAGKTVSEPERQRAFALMRGIDRALAAPLVDLEGLAAKLDGQNVAGINLPLRYEDPPVLTRTWRGLVALAGDANKAALKYLPDNALVETFGPWLTWSRETKPFKLAEQKGPNSGYVIDLLAETRRAGNLVNMMVVTPRKRSAVAGAKYERRNVLSPKRDAQQAPQPKAKISLAQVEHWLTKLVRTHSLRGVLEPVYARIAEDKPSPFKAASFRRFLAVLDPLLDDFMVETYGADELVRRMLGSLALPPERIAEQFTALLELKERRLAGDGVRPPRERRRFTQVPTVTSTVRTIRNQMARQIRGESTATDADTGGTVDS